MADILGKAGWSWAASQPWILKGEGPGLHQPDLLTYFQTRLQAMSEFNLPNRSSNSGRLGGGKASNQYRQCSHFCRIRRSTRSLRGSATTSSRQTEKFRVNPFAKLLLCTTF